MKTLPDNPKPIPPGPWRPSPGEYFLFPNWSSSSINLCKWWDENGMAFVTIADFQPGIMGDYPQTTMYLRRYPNMRFIKPSEKMLNEFVKEFTMVDQVEFYDNAKPEIIEKFTEFMTKISSVT